MKKLTTSLLLIPLILMGGCVHVRTATVEFSDMHVFYESKITTWMVDHGSAQATEARISVDGSYLEWLNRMIADSKTSHFTVIDYEVTNIPWLPLSPRKERRFFSIKYIVRPKDNRPQFPIVVEVELSHDDLTKAEFTPGKDDYYQATALARARDLRGLLTQAGQKLSTRIRNEQ